MFLSDSPNFPKTLPLTNHARSKHIVKFNSLFMKGLDVLFCSFFLLSLQPMEFISCGFGYVICYICYPKRQQFI